MKLLKLVPDDTNIKFLKWRVPFYVVSVLLMILSWVAVFTMGLNYGVDFAGGQEVRLTFEQREEAPIPQLRSLVGGLGYGEPVVQGFGQANQVSIRVPLPEGVEGTPGAATEIGNRVIAAIGQEYPAVRTDGNETVHDVSLTMGFFAVTQLEFSLQIIAAILAIIGYSLNDTIVIYDRIRENLKKFRKMPVPELLDLSVNETLARTVMTSLTLLVALVPLLLVGPASLWGMVAAITLGIFVGTYSSVYMAAPLLIWMGVTSNSFVPQEGKADQQEKIARGEA